MLKKIKLTTKLNNIFGFNSFFYAKSFYKWVLLFSIFFLLISLVFRFYDILYFLPYISDQEKKIVDDAFFISSNQILNGFTYSYSFLLNEIYSLISIFEKVSKEEFHNQVISDPSKYYYLARVFNVFLNGSIGLLLYVLSKKYFSKKHALIVFLILLAVPFFDFIGNFEVNMFSLITLLAIASLYFTMKLDKRLKIKNIIIYALLVGAIILIEKLFFIVVLCLIIAFLIFNKQYIKVRFKKEYMIHVYCSIYLVFFVCYSVYFAGLRSSFIPIACFLAPIVAYLIGKTTSKIKHFGPSHFFFFCMLVLFTFYPLVSMTKKSLYVKKYGFENSYTSFKAQKYLISNYSKKDKISFFGKENILPIQYSSDSLYYNAKSEYFINAICISINRGDIIFVSADEELNSNQKFNKYKIKSFNKKNTRYGEQIIIFDFNKIELNDTISNPKTEFEKLFNGTIIYKNGFKELSYMYFKEASKSDNIGVLEVLVGICEKENLYPIQISILNKLSSLKDNYNYNLKKGVIYLKFKDYNSALSEFNMAINLGCKLPEVYYNRALCYINMNMNIQQIKLDLEEASKGGNQKAKILLNII